MSEGAAEAPYVVEAGPAGTRFTELRRFAELDSTNRYLVDEALDAPRDGLVAVAEHQSAGRGRLGRPWEAPAGANLLVSILVTPRLAADQLHLCSVAAALATAEACRRAAALSPSLKWPNDLLVGERKLAGVLAESVPLQSAPGEHPSERRAVVVGVGLNVGWPPPDDEPGIEAVPPELRGIATSIRRETARDVGPRLILDFLLADLEHRLVDLDTAAGRQRLGREYRESCTTLGRPVRVVLPDGETTGTAIDITPEGHLVVDVGACFTTVTAGDVVHLHTTG